MTDLADSIAEFIKPESDLRRKLFSEVPAEANKKAADKSEEAVTPFFANTTGLDSVSRFVNDSDRAGMFSDTTSFAN